MNKETPVSYHEELKQAGLQELQDRMSRALGLAVLVTCLDGRPLTVPSNLTPFCALLHATPEGRSRCEASRAGSAGAAAAAGEDVLHTCHAGLVHLAVPLRVAGETVAVVLSGHAALRPLGEEAVARLACEVGLDPGELWAAAAAQPVWSEERLRAAGALVGVVTGTVSRLVYVAREARKRADQLAFLYDFSRTMSGSLEVSEVAQRALEAVLKVTSATSGSVVMLSEETPGALASETAATVEPGDEFRIVPAGEVVAAVEREGRAVHFDSRPGAGTAAERRPAVAVPLTVGGKVTGVLTVAGRPEGAPFSEDEAAFLTTLGTGLGLALQNARFFRQIQARAAMLERLVSLGQALDGHLDEDKVLETALVGVGEVLGAQWCAIRLLDGETGELVLKASSGMSAELQERAARVRPEGSLLGEVLRRGEPVVVEDTAAAGPGMQPPYYAPEMRAMAVAPVRAMGKMLGTLKVYSPLPRRWSEEEVGYLAIVAGQVGLALENARLYQALRRYYLSTLQALAAAMEAKDTYTRGHSMRVARLAQACARALGLSHEHQEHLYLAALLHDIGKIGVPESVLLKPGPLEPADWDEVKNHPVVGVRIVEPAGFHPQVVAAIRHHHENYGGGGYPDDLAGEEIPLLARIISVADAYDAMTSDRPYRGARTAEEAMEELRRGAGRQFDPRVVNAFLRIPAAEMEEIGGGGG
ncbi:MAG: HD domain-containing phosphohydrolase [Bacillota bacterium]